MPVFKTKLNPGHPHHQAMVQEIVRHLQKKEGKARFPRIYEEESSILSNTMNVYVLWNKFQSVTVQERAEIILEAYEIAQGKPEMLRIAIALGLTPLEAENLGLNLNNELPNPKFFDPES